MLPEGTTGSGGMNFVRLNQTWQRRNALRYSRNTIQVASRAIQDPCCLVLALNPNPVVRFGDRTADYRAEIL